MDVEAYEEGYLAAILVQVRESSILDRLFL